MLAFVDNSSRKIWVYFLRQRNKASPMFKKFEVLVENQTGRKIKKLRNNNGLEFYKKEFNEFCVTQGITRHKILVRKPQQNGVIECINETLLERARCMLSNANIWHRRDFWA